MRWLGILPGVFLLAAGVWLTGARSDQGHAVPAIAAAGSTGYPGTMAAAAAAFIATLDIAGREAALKSFDDAERFNWHYFPRDREGLSLKQMTPLQRRAAHDLMRASLSAAGYLKAVGIMFLEQVLYDLEGGNADRDPEAYYFTIFGNPSSGTEPWGWRVEGHHLSLNYSSVEGQGVAVTPAFMGTNPAAVPGGPAAGLRVLALEEDLARELVNSLDPSQRALAVISEAAFPDIITGTERRARIGVAQGLPAADMSPVQRELLLRLVTEVVGNMRSEYADEQMSKMQAAGFDSLHFAWAGGTEVGEGHYYRIHGPTVVFEYDNTQNDANHIHTVWRDLEGDFGEDLLARHYQESPHHR